jgi:hypothetical protein
MSKVQSYRNTLRNLDEWDNYLLQESRLPGPRANLELLEAVVEEGNEEKFFRYLSFDSLKAPTNSPYEFLAICGAAGLGKLISEGKTDLFGTLRLYASDVRWRVREAVAIGLQRIGDANMDLLVQELTSWSVGSLLERRAVIAALCEPKLLTNHTTVLQLLKILNQITLDLLSINDKKHENFKVLRKTLGYGWSVAVVASPELGKEFMEKWFLSEDKDIRWIMKENLRKERLLRMDSNWSEKWKKALGVS